MTLNILALAKQVEELVKNGGSGGTSDYEQLSKKPQINSHTLIGNKSAHDLGLATEEAVSGKSTVTANPEGTSSGDLSSIGINGTKYNIPSGGGGSDIPDFPQQRGYFLKTAQGNSGIELEWENFKDNVREIVNPIFQNSDFYVGKVLTRYGTGINDYGWEDAPGASETTLFDDIVYVDSQSTGAGWAEIPLADRVELFDNNLLKFHRVHMEVSFVTEMKADVRSRTENFSCDFDLDRILVTDAQDYSDPEHSTVNDNNAQAYTYHHYLVNSGENYAENAIEVNLNFNLFGTNPAPAVNTFAGRLIGLYFENRLVSTGASQALPSEQGIRVKITAK